MNIAAFVRLQTPPAGGLFCEEEPVKSFAFGTFMLVSLLAVSPSYGQEGPVHVAALFDNQQTALRSAVSVAVSGHYLYAASFAEDGIEIIDMADPAHPVHVSSLRDNQATALDGARWIEVAGPYAYVASRFDSGLEIIDVSDPANPVHVAALFDTPQYALAGARNVWVEGTLAYVAGFDDDGIAIIDISNPAAPVHVASVFDDQTMALDGAYAVTVRGPFAYVAGREDDGLEILKISDPSNPVHAGALFDDGQRALDGARAIRVDGPYAYIASYVDNGVEVVDISDPRNPQHVGALFDTQQTALEAAWAIDVVFPYAFVAANRDGGIEVVDISNPANPTHAGALFDDAATALSGARSIRIQGAFAYGAAFFDNGIEVMDVSHFTGSGNPPVVGDIPDQTILSGERFLPIRLDDVVADPDDPDSLMTWSWSGNSALRIRFDTVQRRIRVGAPLQWNGSETITFTATDPAGGSDSDEATFTVLPGESAQVVSVRNYPNPFNPSTTISYALEYDGPVSLTVYDMLGRRVAMLVDGVQEAGTHSVVWNGTGQSREPVASGLYLYILRAGNTVVTRKMLLAK